MNKPFQLWWSTFRSLGMRVSPAKLKSLLNVAAKDRTDENCCLHVEPLENRVMLSSVSILEGESITYSTTLESNNGAGPSAEFEVWVDLGDGTDPFAAVDFSEENTGPTTEVSVDDLRLEYADDGEFTATISLVANGVTVDFDTVDFSVENVAPIVNVAGSGSEFFAGADYYIEFSATDPGDDSISSWIVDWGDGIVQEFDGDQTHATHVYVVDGEYSVSVSAVDEDGQHSAATIKTQAGFGNLGFVVSQRDGEQRVVESTELNDGSVLVVGNETNTETNSSNGYLAKYNFDGSTDTTFGENGFVQIDLGAQTEFELTTHEVLDSGQIIIGGNFSSEGSNVSMALLRYNADGTLDVTFGNSDSGIAGVVLRNVAGENTFAKDIAVWGDQIFAIGNSLSLEGSANVAIVKYTPDGLVDSTFGSEGITSVSFGAENTENESGISIAFLADNSLLVLGQTTQPDQSTSTVGIVKLNADGAVDQTFAVDGLLALDTLFESNTTSMLNLGEDQFVVAGNETAAQSGDVVVYRFNSNGSVDNDFGIAGKALLFHDASESSSAKVAQVEDKLYVLSNLESGGYVISRLDSDGILDQSFGQDGQRLIAGGDDVSASALIVSYDNGILVVGDKTNSTSLDRDVALQKYIPENVVSISEQLDPNITLFGLPATISNTFQSTVGNPEAYNSDVWRPDIDAADSQLGTHGIARTNESDWGAYVIDESLEEVEFGDDLKIEVSASATGSGYLMYSSEDLASRFNMASENQGQSEHIIAVRLNSNGQWQYNDGFDWNGFTPIGPDAENADFLIAEIDFDTSTLVSLEGTNDEIAGLKLGYVAGDVEIVATPSGTSGPGDPNSDNDSNPKTFDVLGSSLWRGNPERLGNQSEDGTAFENTVVYATGVTGGYYLYMQETYVNREVGEGVDGYLAEKVETTITTSIVFVTDTEIIENAVSANEFDIGDFDSFIKTTTDHTFVYTPISKQNPLAVVTSAYTIQTDFVWVKQQELTYPSPHGITSRSADYNTSGSGTLTGLTRLYAGRSVQPDGSIDESYTLNGTGTASIVLNSDSSYTRGFSTDEGSTTSTTTDDISMVSFDQYLLNGRGFNTIETGSEANSNESLFADDIEELGVESTTLVIDSYQSDDPTEAGTISGIVFEDSNNDGINEENENGISLVGITLWHDIDNDGIGDEIAGLTFTDSEGAYSFENLIADNSYLLGVQTQLGGEISSVGTEAEIESESALVPVVVTVGESVIVNAGVRAIDTQYGFTNHGNELYWGTGGTASNDPLDGDGSEDQQSGDNETGDGQIDTGGDSNDSASNDQPTFNTEWIELGLSSFGWYQLSSESTWNSNYGFSETEDDTGAVASISGESSGSSTLSSLGANVSSSLIKANGEGGEDTFVSGFGLDISNTTANGQDSNLLNVTNSSLGQHDIFNATDSSTFTATGASTSTNNLMLTNSTSEAQPIGDVKGVIQSSTNVMKDQSDLSSTNRIDIRSVLTTQRSSNEQVLEEGEGVTDSGEGDNTADQDVEYVHNQDAIDYLMAFVPTNMAEVARQNALENEDDNGDSLDSSSQTPPSFEAQDTNYLVLQSTGNSSVSLTASGSSGLAIYLLDKNATDVQVLSTSDSVSTGESTTYSTADSFGRSGDYEAGDGSYYKDNSSNSTTDSWIGTNSNSAFLTSYSLNANVARASINVGSDDGGGFGGGGSNYGTGTSTGESGDFGGGSTGDESSDTATNEPTRAEGVSGSTNSISSMQILSATADSSDSSESGGLITTGSVDDGNYETVEWLITNDFAELSNSSGGSNSDDSLNFLPGKSDSDSESTSSHSTSSTGGGGYRTFVNRIKLETFDAALANDGSGDSGSGSDGGGSNDTSNNGTGDNSGSTDPNGPGGTGAGGATSDGGTGNDQDPTGGGGLTNDSGGGNDGFTAMPEENLVYRVKSTNFTYETSGELDSNGSIISGSLTDLQNQFVDNSVFDPDAVTPETDPFGSNSDQDSTEDELPEYSYSDSLDVSRTKSGSSSLNHQSSYNLNTTAPEYKMSLSESLVAEYLNEGFVMSDTAYSEELTSSGPQTQIVNDTRSSSLQWKEDGLHTTLGGQLETVSTSSVSKSNPYAIEDSVSSDNGEGGTAGRSIKINANDNRSSYDNTTTNIVAYDDFGTVSSFDTARGQFVSVATGSMTLTENNTGSEGFYQRGVTSNGQAFVSDELTRSNLLSYGFETIVESDKNTWDLTDKIEVDFGGELDSNIDDGQTNVKHTISGDRNTNIKRTTNSGYYRNETTRNGARGDGSIWNSLTIQEGHFYSPSGEKESSGTRSGTITTAFDEHGDLISASGTHQVDVTFSGEAVARSKNWFFSENHNDTTPEANEYDVHQTVGIYDSFEGTRQSTRTARTIEDQTDGSKSLVFDSTNNVENHVRGNRIEVVHTSEYTYTDREGDSETVEIPNDFISKFNKVVDTEGFYIDDIGISAWGFVGLPLTPNSPMTENTDFDMDGEIGGEEGGNGENSGSLVGSGEGDQSDDETGTTGSGTMSSSEEMTDVRLLLFQLKNPKHFNAFIEKFGLDGLELLRETLAWGYGVKFGTDAYATDTWGMDGVDIVIDADTNPFPFFGESVKNNVIILERAMREGRAGSKPEKRWANPAPNLFYVQKPVIVPSKTFDKSSYANLTLTHNGVTVADAWRNKDRLIEQLYEHQKDYLTRKAVENGVAGGIGKLASFGFIAMKAKLASNRIVNLAEANITNSGKTVLGHFPGYIDKAKAKGASFFDIGDAWDSLTDAQRWAANTHFLDKIADAGDQVLLSLPKGQIREGSYLAREIDYLINVKGYKWINQWALGK